MRKAFISFIMIMCLIFAAGCGAEEEKEATAQESTNIESSIDDSYDEYQDDEGAVESDELDPLHYSGDRETKKDTWGSYEFSRPISYTEMVQIYKDYYVGTLNLDESLDDDAYLEADEQLCKSVAEEYDLTYEEFMAIFGILANDDIVAIHELYN